MVKFNKFAVVNTATKAKARVWYWRTTLTDKRECITVCAKDYGAKLAAIFGDALPVKNDTEFQTDYFETDRVRIFPGTPFYDAAAARVRS